MAKTKREINAIIINFSVTIVLFIASLSVLLFYILPWYNDVSDLKIEAMTTYEEYKEIQKKWQSFNDFKKSVESMSSGDDSSYTNKILEDIDNDFYQKYLVNTEYNNYDSFVTEISKKYSDTTEFEEKTKKLAKILPSYSDQISDFWDNFLTDFKFINYIESLADTFNINFNNSIGIQDVNVVEGYSTSANDSSLETSIYYIPLELDVSWRKESILDFIYFIKRVGQIQETKTKDGDYDISFVQWVSSTFKTLAIKAISWQERKQWYDLFNNQMSDIEYIEFPEYPDSSFDLNNNYSDVISFVKNTQWRESINVKIGLRFYVKGLPIYKIEEQILDFIKLHQRFKWLLAQKVSDPNASSNIKKLAQTRLVTISEIDQSIIPNLRASLAQKDWLDEAYNKSFEYIETYKKYADEIWIELEIKEEKEQNNESENTKD